MAERVWHWLRQRDPGQGLSLTEPWALQTSVGRKRLPRLSAYLGRGGWPQTLDTDAPRPSITQASQTGAREGAFDLLGFSPGFDTPRIVITLDNGTERLLADALAEVMTMWEDIATNQLIG